MLMSTAGKISSCGVVNMVLIPSLHMLPHEGVGGATPMPMNDRKASVKMAAAAFDAEDWNADDQKQ